jgi:calcineurin-like phosphoesterase family protein
MLKIKIDDMGSGVFFTSDLHFRHGNIIKYCDRPFASVQEQTEKLIDNWNKTVPDTATVFILGDFAFATKNQWRGILNQLTGKKYLILGNHDRAHEIPTEEFVDICDLAELSVRIEENHWETFILSHRPLLCWEGSNDGVKHLFGHVHSCDSKKDICENGDTDLVKLLKFRPMLDVGVDNNNYCPISIFEVLDKIKANGQCIQNS